MQALVVAVVLGSLVPLVSCKPIARETESEPEFFRRRAIKKVQNFLQRAQTPPNTSVSRILRQDFSADHLLPTAVKEFNFETFKEVVDGLDKHGFYSEWDLEEVLLLAIKYRKEYPDADMKIAYLVEKGGNVDYVMKQRMGNPQHFGVSLNAVDLPYLVQIGVAEPNKAMIYAIRDGNIDVVRRVVEEFGANNFDEGLRMSVKKNNIDMAKYMMDKGATDLHGALAAVPVKAGNIDSYGSPKILELLLEHTNNTNIGQINKVLDAVTHNIDVNRKREYHKSVKILERMQQTLQQTLQGALPATP